MNAIIIEDEAVAARRLRKLVEKYDVKIIGELHSVKEAVNWFGQNLSPDLIFLDIQLGDGFSFEIFEKVQPQSAIIFTTAYDEFALKAFKLNSVDYLLKPIQEKAVKQALEKFKTTRFSSVPFSAKQLQSLLGHNFENAYRERFLVQIGAQLKSIEADEVSLFFSRDKATYLCTQGREYMLEESLEDLENQLSSKKFFRISRQAIVHLPFIENIYAYSGSRLKLKIYKNKEEWIVSRERVRAFKNWLKG